MTELDNKNATSTPGETVQESDELSHPSSAVPKRVPKLPLELLELILPQVPPPQKRTFYVCSLVSKLWHNIALRFLWNEITIAQRSNFSVLSMRNKLPLVRLLRYQLQDTQGFFQCIFTGALAGVRILELGHWVTEMELRHWVTERSLAKIFIHCPRLIALDSELDSLWHDRPTLDETRVLREGFGKLKSLKLNVNKHSERLLQLAAESVGDHLESITLVTSHYATFEYDRPLSLIGQRCPNLRDLSAQSTSWIRLMIPLLPDWGRLLRLQCRFSVSDELLEQIATLCVNLKYLELSLKTQSLRILAKGPFLCEINFGSLNDVSADDFAYWLQHRGGSLTVFSARSFKCPDELLKILARFAPNLKAAGVGHVESSRRALAILRGCAKLETLSIRDYTFGIIDHTVYHIAASQRVSVTSKELPLTPYVDLMKEKWTGL